jgi:hypothetical protein
VATAPAELATRAIVAIRLLAMIGLKLGRSSAKTCASGTGTTPPSCSRGSAYPSPLDLRSDCQAERSAARARLVSPSSASTNTLALACVPHSSGAQLIQRLPPIESGPLLAVRCGDHCSLHSRRCSCGRQRPWRQDIRAWWAGGRVGLSLELVLSEGSENLSIGQRQLLAPRSRHTASEQGRDHG